MKTWSYWLPDLIPHVPECPQILAEHELRRSAQEFFRNTLAWRVTEADRPVLADEYEVDATPLNSDHELVRIDSAWYDGRLLEPVTYKTMDAKYCNDWQAHTGSPTHYMQEIPGVVRLYPIPTANATDGLKLRIIVAPSETATGLPDDIAIKYREDVQVGAKARLMLYPGKTWSNPELAVFYSKAFENMIGKANIDAARGHVQARIPSRVTWC